MRLKPELLTSHLDKYGVGPVFLICGDEPLQMMELADQIRRFARKSGYAERTILDVGNDFQWHTLLQESASMSLFSSKRLLDLRLAEQRPGKVGGKILIEYCENIPSDTCLLITSSYLNKQAQQTKWYKALDKTGIIISFWSVELADLPGWIILRGNRFGKKITKTAANMIADRVEGNLLAAAQEIEKLCMLVDKDRIDIEEVMMSVSDNTRFDVFSMITSALSGQSDRTIRMLQGLQSEGIEPAAVYGAMVWDYRRLCSMAFRYQSGTSLDKLFNEERIWDKKKKHAINSVLQRYQTFKLYQLLRKLDAIDKILKSSDRIFVWDAMQEFLVTLSGKSINAQLGKTVN